MTLSPGSWTALDPQPEEQELPPLITPAEVAAWTRGKIPQSAPGLEGACAGVSESIRDIIGWHLFPVLRIDDLIDGPGGRILHLPTRYLRSIEAVEYAGQPLDVDTYRWSVSGFLESTYGWPTGFRSIRVQFTSGFSAVPSSVKQLAVGIVSRAAASPLGLTREQAGQVSLGFGGSAGAGGGIGLLESERTTLEPYRIVGS